MLLAGKTALITEAASGIGRATAECFAREGARVVVADKADGRNTVESIRAAGGEAMFIGVDLVQMSDVQRLIQFTLGHYKRLDVIHSNASLFRPGSATELSEEDWDLVLNTHLKSVWQLAKFGVPAMLASGGGVFLITSSIQAIEGFPRSAAYQAAKGGLLAFTRSLAADYAPSIRVNAILPGGVDTGLGSWASLTEAQKAARAERIPLKRNGRAEDVANAALFLASDMSAHITAQCLIVDGGRTAMELNWPK